MRRYWKSVMLSVVIISISAIVVFTQKFSIGGNEFGSDAVLGLQLGLDLQGGSHLVYQSDLKDQDGISIPPSSTQMQALIKTIERRVNSSGLGEPNIQLIGEDRLLVQLPGITDPDRAKSLIGETARLEFKHRYTDASDPIDDSINNGIQNVKLDFYPNPYSTEDDSDKSTDSSATSSDSSTSKNNVPDSSPLGIFVNFGDDAYSRVKTLHDQLITSLESPGYDRLQVEISGGEENVRFELLGTFITEVDNEKQFSFMIPSDTYSSLDDAKSKLGDEIDIEKFLLLCSSFFVSVVLPAPEGEDKTNIIPFVSNTIVLFTGLMFF